jgi:hypothetical protein
MQNGCAIDYDPAKWNRSHTVGLTFDEEAQDERLLTALHTPDVVHCDAKSLVLCSTAAKAVVHFSLVLRDFFARL